MRIAAAVPVVLFMAIFSVPAFADCPEGSNWTSSWTDSYGQTTYTLQGPCKAYLGIPYTITATVTDPYYPNDSVGWNWAISDNGSILASNSNPITGIFLASGSWTTSVQQTYTSSSSVTNHSITFSFTDFGQGSGGHGYAGSTIGGLTVDPYLITLAPAFSLSASQQTTMIIPATVYNPSGGNLLSYRWLEGSTVIQASQPVVGSGYVSVPLNLAALPALSLGTHTFTLEVTDGTLTGDKSTAVTVTLPLPTISGSPATIVAAGTPYSFTPTATNAASFSITNKPFWASFNTSTGVLTGTPTNTGTYPNIVISASNAAGNTSLTAFSITVSSSGGSGSGTTVPVMDGWWLLPGILAGVGILTRRRKP